MTRSFRAPPLIGATLRSRVLRASLAVALLSACGTDDPLAPPDGVGCTVGTIAPGDSVEGIVSSASCEIFDPSSLYITYAQSWTLEAKAGTAYVVRVWHRPGPGAIDHLGGDVMLFGRNPQGDPSFITGEWGVFGTANSNNSKHLEMAFQPDRDRTFSIRVTAYQKSDTGAYALTVTACPSTAITDTTTLTGIDFAAGTCLSLAGDPSPTRLKFFHFASDSGVRDTVVFHRTAGNAGIWSMLSGPGADLECWNLGCVADAATTFDSTALRTVKPKERGMMSIILGVAGDSAATLSLSTHFKTPPVAAAGRN